MTQRRNFELAKFPEGESIMAGGPGSNRQVHSKQQAVASCELISSVIGVKQRVAGVRLFLKKNFILIYFN